MPENCLFIFYILFGKQNMTHNNIKEKYNPGMHVLWHWLSEQHLNTATCCSSVCLAACGTGLTPTEEWIMHQINEAVNSSRETSLVAQTVKNLPAMPVTQVRSLGWEDPLEKGMATHSSILAWRIPWTEEPGGLQSMGSQTVRYKWATFTPHFTPHLTLQKHQSVLKKGNIKILRIK